MSAANSASTPLRRLAARRTPRVARLEQLPDLHVALRVGAENAVLAGAFLVARRPTAADLPVRAAGPDQRVDGDERAGDGDDPDEGSECLLHVRMIAVAGLVLTIRRQRGRQALPCPATAVD